MTTESNIWLPTSYTFYTKPTELEMTRKKLEAYDKLIEIQNFYRRRPDKFINDFIGFELLDVQTYLLMNSWTTPNNLWLECRGAGKSTMIAIYVMAKSLLFNNYQSYIAAGSSDQSIETFSKIEALASKAISSAGGLTGEFLNELKVSQASGSGFIRNPMGYSYTTWNGSRCVTLNSNIDKKRGKRGNLVVFDETGFLLEEMLAVYAAFVTVKKDFELTKNKNIKATPKPIENILIYASSASSIDTPYYKKVIDMTKKRIVGDPNYFICDVNCDMVINATYKGEKYRPLISQETIEMETRANAEKANREYRNVFTTDGGINSIIKRSLIQRNSYTRVPILSNDNTKHYICFAYDPARSCDNSILAIGDMYEDPILGWKMDIINCVSFVDMALKKKTPLITGEQIKLIKELLLEYSGDDVSYSNIHKFVCDAGSGGGGNRLPEEFFEDWIDKKGETHRGLIDTEYSEEYVKRYPNAVKDIIKFVDPAKYKSDMAEAAIKMIEANLVTFPETYDKKGYLLLIDTNKALLEKSETAIRAKLDKLSISQSEYEIRLSEALMQIDAAKTTVYKLSSDEEAALIQINYMKEEIVNICRYKNESGGKDKFHLPVHKDADLGVESENTMHDDRFYAWIMLMWILSEKRMESIRKKKKNKKPSDSYSHVRAPRKVTQF